MTVDSQGGFAGGGARPFIYARPEVDLVRSLNVSE